MEVRNQFDALGRILSGGGEQRIINLVAVEGIQGSLDSTVREIYPDLSKSDAKELGQFALDAFTAGYNLGQSDALKLISEFDLPRNPLLGGRDGSGIRYSVSVVASAFNDDTEKDDSRRINLVFSTDMSIGEMRDAVLDELANFAGMYPQKFSAFSTDETGKIILEIIGAQKRY